MNIVFYHHDPHGILCANALSALLPGSTTTCHTAFARVDLSRLSAGQNVYLCGLFTSIELIKKIHDKTKSVIKVYTNDPMQIMQLENCNYGYIQGTWTEKHAPLVSIWEEFGGTKYMTKLERAVANYHNWTFDSMEEKAEAVAIFRRLDIEHFSIGNVNHVIQLPYETLVEEGKLITSYLDHLYEELVEDLAYWTTLKYEGKSIQGLCINVVGSSDILSKDRTAEKAKLFINYKSVGDRVCITLYNRDGNINVGHIASVFGGGGKPDVAGMWCKKFPFGENPRTTNESINTVYGNPYPVSYKIMMDNPIVSKYVDHVSYQECTVSTKNDILHNHKFVVMNTPIHTKALFLKYRYTHKLGISYVFTNTGYYRVRISAMQKDEVDLEDLNNQLNGTICGDEIWLYTKLLPFNIRTKE